MKPASVRRGIARLLIVASIVMVLLAVGAIFAAWYHISRVRAESVRAKPSLETPDSTTSKGGGAGSSKSGQSTMSAGGSAGASDGSPMQAFPHEKEPSSPAAPVLPPSEASSSPAPSAPDVSVSVSPAPAATPPVRPVEVVVAPSPAPISDAVLAEASASFERDFGTRAESWRQSLSKGEIAIRASIGRGDVQPDALWKAVDQIRAVVHDIALCHVSLRVQAAREFKNLPLRQVRPFGGFIVTMVRDFSCDGPDTPSENRCHWGAVQEWMSVLEQLRSVGRSIEDAIEAYSVAQSRSIRSAAGRAARKSAANAEARKFLLEDPLPVKVEVAGAGPIEFQVKLSDFVRQTAYTRERNMIRSYEAARGSP